LPATNSRLNKPDLEVLDLVTRKAKPIRIGGISLYIKTNNKIEIKIGSL
jgi:hypothetical protein